MKTTFSVAGDMLVQRRIPRESTGFDPVSAHLKKADARYFNLETTLLRGDYYGNQYNGGSYLRADPAVLEDARAYGFNMLSFSNNHAMDFGHEGLVATKQAVDEAGFVNAGVGANLDEAASAAFLDTPNGRVALIGVVSTMVNDAAMAGKQSRRVPGRPGVNGLRVQEHLQVTAEQMQVIREIGRLSHINAREDIKRAEGYTAPLPEGTAVLKDLRFRQGDETRYVTHPHPEDMARVEKAPATVFYIPALIPLVPGGSLYYAMSYAVRSDWDMVGRYGSATFYCALGIACGMSIVLAMEYTINKLAAQRKP